MALAVFGGGLGFLVWHTFGVLIVRPAPEILSGPMLGRLPTDVWQPEGFVFPSMLTHDLFMVSLCLILTVFLAVLVSQKTWTRVAIGAVASLVLMNIHSYDVLLVGLVLLGLVVMQASRRALTLGWVGRAALVIAGSIPAALWFVHVLANDPVFQARAATQTYSPNFRQVLFGYLPMMILGFGALAARPAANGAERKRRIAGSLLAAVVFGVFTYAAKDAVDGTFFLSPVTWGAAFAAMLVSLVLLADENPAWNLIASWALIGTVAIYFPGLFQRKLAMGLSVPWAILAALAIAYLGRNQERNPRNLATALFIILMSASSFRWLLRELDFIRWNVSSTTLQPVYLNQDVVKILNNLNSISGRKVVVAPPGVQGFVQDSNGGREPDMFLSPMVPDLNPIVSGLTGSYTYAGHWSETPDYNRRRGELSQLFYGSQPVQLRLDTLHQIGAQYIIAPVPEAFPQLKLFDFRAVGKVVVDGSEFRLIVVGG
jgi:hypothetical protein